MDCDPCDATELLSQPIASNSSGGGGGGGGSTADLQALALSSLPQLPDPSCGFRPGETPYQDTLPEEPLHLNQAYMTSQMSDLGMTMASEVQNPPGREVVNSMMDG